MESEYRSPNEPMAEMSAPLSGIKRRGFASMSEERRRELARRGGQNAHQLGRAHRFSELEARAAGRKGGKVTGQNIEHMSRIGSLGSSTRWQRDKGATGQAPAGHSNATDCPPSP